MSSAFHVVFGTLRWRSFGALIASLAVCKAPSTTADTAERRMVI
jgi:hypothetical protein